MDTDTSVQDQFDPSRHHLLSIGVFWTIVIVAFALWDQLSYSLGANREELRAQALVHLAVYGGIWAIGILALYFVGKGLQRHLTEVCRAQEVLRKSEDFKQSILNSVSAQIAVLDRNGIILAVNEPWRRFAQDNSSQPGKPAPGTDIGNNYLNACRADHDTWADGAIEARDGIRAVIEGRLSRFTLEYPCHSPSEQHWFSMSATPMGGQAHSGVVITHTNITERRLAEEALRAREERFRDLFDRASDGIMILSPSGELVAVNESFSRMHGYSSEEMQTLNIRDLDTPETFRSVPERMQYILSGKSAIFEVEHYHKDGHVFPLEVSASLIVSDGKPLIQSLHRDITERKQAEAERALLEAQLRETQKMEAIGDLAGGIAREFNNAVAAILGNLELAREDLIANPPALESLDEIRKAGIRARNLVQQILAFSRRHPTELRPISLAAAVEQSVSLLHSALPANMILDVHYEIDVPAVMADATQIEQVVLNLATNAMQAMHGLPGHIGIRLDSVLLDSALADAHPELRAMHAKRPGLTARLAVSDDGPGMDSATLARIFEPFFSTRKGDEATGMGLAVVHGIVQEHAGAIVVDSRPGKGSTFTLYLSRAREHAEAPPPPPRAAAAYPVPVPAADIDAQRILYIDDDEALVFLMQRLLERRGFRISGYSDQREALAALRARPDAFDLVVSDYNMPGMSGLDVAREVRAIRADLPLAIASGFIDEQLRAEAPAAGVRELIFKADAAEALCEAVARLARTLGEKSSG